MSAKKISVDKKTTNKKTGNTVKETRHSNQILLALSLVPLVMGVILVSAWALDITLVGELETQHFLGFMLILAGFALANLAQRLWLAFAGWTLLVLADLLLLAVVDLWAQVVAFCMAGMGVVLLVTEFYRRWKERQSSD